MRSLVLLAVLLNLGFPQEWHKEVFDTTDSPFRVSLALDSSGLPRVAYGWRKRLGNNIYSYALRYAEYQGINNWRIETIDSSNSAVADYFPFLCLDARGKPHVAFVKWSDDDSNCEIVYAFRDDTIWSIQSVDTFFHQPWNTEVSMALSQSGKPWIAYRGVINPGSGTALRYAVREGDTWHKQTLWTHPSHRAYSPSITVSSRGEPGIAFIVSTGSDIAVDSVLWMWRDSTGWHTSCIDTLFLEGAGPSAQLDSTDRAHVVYCYDDACLRYAVQEEGGWRKQSIHNISVGWYGYHDLKLDSRGLASIGAVRDLWWLPLYFYQNPPGVWHYEYVEGVNPYHPTFSNISLAFNRQGSPFLAYTREDTYNLVHFVVAQRVVGIETQSPTPIPSLQFIVTPTIARQFSLSFSADVAGELKIYTADGSSVFTKSIPAGLRTLSWHALTADGKPLPKGVYFVRFQTQKHSASQKIVVH